MGIVVEPGKAGARGFDTNVKLTKASALKMKQAGFDFAIRYLTRKATPPAGDLSKAETAAILEAGGLKPVPQQRSVRGLAEQMAIYEIP